MTKEIDSKLRKSGYLSGFKRLLTTKEAAEYLGISPKTLWEWTQRGVIPRVEIPGTKSKYDLNDLEKLIQENKHYVPEETSNVVKNILAGTGHA